MRDWDRRVEGVVACPSPRISLHRLHDSLRKQPCPWADGMNEDEANDDLSGSSGN